MLTEFRRAFRQNSSAELGAVLQVPVEGPRLVAEALRSGLRVEKVLFSAQGYERFGAKLAPQFSKNTVVALADDDAFDACMDVDHPQGVAALVRLPLSAPDKLLTPAPPLIVAAAGLQDPGNIGTLIRAAEAFGATGVIALEETVSPLNPKAVRASAGSLFRVPVSLRVAGAELIAFCKRHGIRLLAASARPETQPAPLELTGPVCLVIGQEAAGVPRELLRAADATVSIPMERTIDSLNAGVAAAILLYEAARQRRGQAATAND